MQLAQGHRDSEEVLLSGLVVRRSCILGRSSLLSFLSGGDFQRFRRSGGALEDGQRWTIGVQYMIPETATTRKAMCTEQSSYTMLSRQTDEKDGCDTMRVRW